jgi:hypothetical protein
MKENLSLMVLGGYAVVLMLVGFVWKEIRDLLDRRKQRNTHSERTRRGSDRRQQKDELVSAARG